MFTDLESIPKYENAVCLGAKIRSREWKDSKHEVWAAPLSLVMSFSREDDIRMFSRVLNGVVSGQKCMPFFKNMPSYLP